MRLSIQQSCRFVGILLLLGGRLTDFAGSARAQNALLGEDQVKAAFLYNFAKFIEWPTGAFADHTAPLIICILGRESFAAEVEGTIRGKTVQRHPLRVQRWNEAGNPLPCHVLFVGASERTPPPEILKKSGGVPVLTVGEGEGFARRGGMINFVLTDNKVRFEINNLSAKNAGLQISSKLLQLATHVWE